MESKDSQTTKIFLKNKEKETALPDIKNSYKATIVKIDDLMLGKPVDKSNVARKQNHKCRRTSSMTKVADHWEMAGL